MPKTKMGRGVEQWAIACGRTWHESVKSKPQKKSSFFRENTQVSHVCSVCLNRGHRARRIRIDGTIRMSCPFEPCPWKDRACLVCSGHGPPRRHPLRRPARACDKSLLALSELVCADKSILKHVPALDVDAQRNTIPHQGDTTSEMSEEADASRPVLGGPDVVRHFVCRNTKCSKEGHYYGRNTDWISTVADGGWHFMCPVCHLAYQSKAKRHAGVPLLPAQFVLQLPSGLILSEWPGSAEENALAEMMSTLAEEDLGQDAHLLNEVELTTKIWEVTNRHCVDIPKIRDMELSAEVRAYVKAQNRYRTKKRQWSFAHLADGVFRGGFFKYDKEQAFIMTTEQTKMWLALVHEALQRRQNKVFKTSAS